MEVVNTEGTAGNDQAFTVALVRILQMIQHPTEMVLNFHIILLQNNSAKITPDEMVWSITIAVISPLVPGAYLLMHPDMDRWETLRQNAKSLGN